METIHARHVVLGAGAVGAATVYHLSKRREPVVLVEQFSLGHNRGSSHGSARITRHSYADPAYAKLMPEAFRGWKDLEADAGEPLFLRTGGVSISPSGVGYVESVTANLLAMGIPHRRMTGVDLRHTIPIFGVADDTEVVFEPDAGILAAERILKAEIALARHHGGDQIVILENCPVRRIDLGGTHPVLETDNGPIIAERLIVASGPWTARLLPIFSVPLHTTRQQVLYFQPPDPVTYAPGRLPVFIYKGFDDLDAYYGMPASEGLGVKVARHGGSEADPDRPDSVVTGDYRSLVRSFLWKVLPALAEAHIERTEVCLYTVAPDEQFHVGPLPVRSDVLVASACSGHGFKFSNLVGRVLADLATRGETSVGIGSWQSAIV